MVSLEASIAAGTASSQVETLVFLPRAKKSVNQYELFSILFDHYNKILFNDKLEKTLVEVNKREITSLNSAIVPDLDTCQAEIW